METNLARPASVADVQFRRNIHWGRNNRLKVLKMLAWVVFDRELLRNPDALERRVDALCEPIVRGVLGESAVTLQLIREETLRDQGLHITATKLLQRADKTERYCEFNDAKDAVIHTYECLVGSCPNKPNRGEAREEI